jgi:hypothetical protein
MSGLVVRGAIPFELTSEPRFVVWKRELGKKTPYTIDLARRASSTRTRDWGSFYDAVDAVEAGRADGVGYALPDRKLVLVDLDDVLDPDEVLHPAADLILTELGSYSEWSQSGSGLHVLIRATLKGDHCQTKKTPWGGEFAVWDHARFVYLTGDLVEDTPPTIEARQDVLDEMCERHFAHLRRVRDVTRKPSEPLGIDDRDLLEKAFAAKNGDDLRMLIAGAWQGGRYGSQSEADLALCTRLAFWTGRDPDRIDAIFRTSGLYRDKWERDDYRERTIDAAIAATRDVYEPSRQGASQVRPTGDAPAGDAAYEVVKVVPAAEFAAVDEPGAAAILGDPDGPLIPEGGNVMVYGDGGVGKTTAMIDVGYHLAAGDDWQGISVPKPRRVLLVENEGPRPLFRRKMRRKESGWAGSPTEGRVLVLVHPWAQFTFAEPDVRELLADTIAEREIDVAIIGPVTSAGMDAPGTIHEVRDFDRLVSDVRARSGRPELAIVLVHHENRAGKPSGAWEGVVDTLIHVTQQGHGKIRIYFQKAKWASDLHATGMELVWADGDSFVRVEPTGEDRPERVWNDIAEYVLHHGGCSWRQVEPEVTGTGEYLRRRRDAMLEEGILINAGGKGGYKLWHRDDPERPTLETEVRRTADTPADTPASATGDGAETASVSVRRSLKTDAPTDTRGSASPDDTVSDEPEPA